MSKFGEVLLTFLNDLFPEPNSALLTAKESPQSYLEFQRRQSASSFALFDDLNLQDKQVLDLGSGIGSNLLYLLNSGAASVVALDIDEAQLSRAQDLLASSVPDALEQVTFTVADGAHLPFPSEHFDILIAADTLEHVGRLERVLHESARVLRPKGRLYAYFPPFYAPWGAHMVNWIRLPWCQVLFSEKTVLTVARRLENEGRSVNNQLAEGTRLDLGEGDCIPFVNHLTVRGFTRAVRAVPNLHLVRQRLLPPGWRRYRTPAWLINSLTRNTALVEFLTAKAAFTLQKIVE